MRAAWARAMVEEVAVACLSRPISSIPALPCYHVFGNILVTLILLLLFEARFEKLGGEGQSFQD